MTDEIQEKIDRIDILESQLEKEKNMLIETQKQVADIKEELQITEQRYQMIILEKA
jgi:archaellum component FlaC